MTDKWGGVRGICWLMLLQFRSAVGTNNVVLLLDNTTVFVSAKDGVVILLPISCLYLKRGHTTHLVGLQLLCTIYQLLALKC